jgi:hypothetical protein
MEALILWLLILAVLAGGLLVYRSSKRKAELERAEALRAVTSVAEEDVTRLGEEVAELDIVTAGRQLDEGARQDYRRALDEYDRAKEALARVQRPEDVRAVTEALEDGRYAAACVHARVEGRPLPVRRPPCFFNPQHGPSVEDVPWAPAGGMPRPVPVCLPDAERVRAGAEPDARKVPVGGGRRPYWEAGPAYAPWAQGYFSPYAMSGLLPGVLVGAMLTGGFGGWDGGGADGGGGDYGDGGGDTGDGGGDTGGDFGGGDGGWGGDFGGGDFGGGDF